jgi:chromosome segregation ATPase
MSNFYAQQNLGSWANIIAPMVAAFLGGGLFIGLSQLITARAQARTAQLQEPGIIAASSLGGAEQAIALMERALARASQEIEEIKRDRDEERTKNREKDGRIHELENQLTHLRSLLGTLSTNVDQTIRQVQEAKSHDKDESV